MIETSSDLPQSSVIFDNIWNFLEIVGKHFIFWRSPEIFRKWLKNFGKSSNALLYNKQSNT